MDRTPQHYLVFKTAQGHCAIAWNDNGIRSLRLPAASAEETERDLRRRLPGARLATPPPSVAATVDAVTRYFAGEKVEFFDVPLDLGEQNDLFLRIYAAARRVGWGRTTTYGTLAKELGDDWELAREVGQAMAKNPIPLIIPCHRVLAAGGKLGGFSAPGGTASKARMLELEGAQLGAPEPAQRSLGF